MQQARLVPLARQVHRALWDRLVLLVLRDMAQLVLLVRRELPGLLVRQGQRVQLVLLVRLGRQVPLVSKEPLAQQAPPAPQVLLPPLLAQPAQLAQLQLLLALLAPPALKALLVQQARLGRLVRRELLGQPGLPVQLV